MPAPKAAIREFTRVLRPDGWVILTFDVCTRGNGEIAPKPYVQLMNHLRDQFELVWPEVSIHPLRMISCYNGPYPMRTKVAPLRALSKWGKDRVRKMIGKPNSPGDYAFQAMVLRRA